MPKCHRQWLSSRAVNRSGLMRARGARAIIIGMNRSWHYCSNLNKIKDKYKLKQDNKNQHDRMHESRDHNFHFCFRHGELKAACSWSWLGVSVIVTTCIKWKAIINWSRIIKISMIVRRSQEIVFFTSGSTSRFAKNDTISGRQHTKDTKINEIINSNKYKLNSKVNTSHFRCRVTLLLVLLVWVALTWCRFKKSLVSDWKFARWANFVRTCVRT